MKKIIIVLLFMSISTAAFCQNDVRGGMGITFISIPALVDYINNQGIAPANQQIGIFSSAVIFSGEADYSLNANHQLGVEVAYLINSYTFGQSIGLYKLDYGIVMPSVIYYYVIRDTGFNIKFGAGAGVRFVNLSQQWPATPSAQSYSSTGFGLLFRADGNTFLSKDLFVNLGFDLRYDVNGKPKDGSQYLVNKTNQQNVSFNAFSAGIRLGMTYSF